MVVVLEVGFTAEVLPIGFSTQVEMRASSDKARCVADTVIQQSVVVVWQDVRFRGKEPRPLGLKDFPVNQCGKFD